MITRIPFFLSVLGMASGVFIAIIFGVNESYFKNTILAGLQNNKKIMAIADTTTRESTIKVEADKNWRYYQRFHFHATGIGAMSLAALLLLALSMAPYILKNISSYMIAIGGLLYPFVWLFSAIYGPSMGRTEAKESFAFFGYMGGLFLFGLILLLFIIAKYPLRMELQKDFKI